MLAAVTGPAPPIDRAALEAVLLPLDRATPLPARAYVDPGVFAVELDRIWDRSWRCVGREDDVIAPGAWLRAPLTQAGVLVVRGEDLAIRAFHDVCPHRGAPLAVGDAGRATSLRCPYHGWQFDLAGRLRGEGAAPLCAGRSRADFALAPVRVEAAHGLLFACLSADAPPIEAAIAGVPARIVRTSPRHTRLARRVEYVVAANWKLVVANFQESCHFPGVHPALEAITPTSRASSCLGDGAWLGGTMELEDGAETVSTTARLDGRPRLVGTSDEDRRTIFDALLFPGLLISVQPDYLLTYRLDPVDVARTRVVADLALHPAALRPGEPCPAAIADFWDRANAEDRAIVERQQLGVASGAFVPRAYSAVEDGVHAFEQRVARALIEAAEGAGKGAS